MKKTLLLSTLLCPILIKPIIGDGIIPLSIAKVEEAGKKLDAYLSKIKTIDATPILPDQETRDAYWEYEDKKARLGHLQNIIDVVDVTAMAISMAFLARFGIIADTGQCTIASCLLALPILAINALSRPETPYYDSALRHRNNFFTRARSIIPKTLILPCISLGIYLGSTLCLDQAIEWDRRLRSR